ncbi:MAG TPA: EAL domain-containing protein [Spongiibacteraceae bacterium]|nr:EAL domain-containing protein [Spongiibacteraceae bacterium]
MRPTTPADNAPVQEARILLADDDPRLLESLRGLLNLYHYQVETALGGAEAIRLLQESTFDLLLLDLRMPEVSGHDVLRHMRDNAIATMTIVVSGETALDDITQALRNGAYDYLKKPYVPEELLATVSNAVRKKRLEDANQVMQARLNRSERLHRFIVNHSPDIIYVLDEQGRFSFLNSKVETLLKYRREELVGRHITTIVEDDDVEKAGYFFEQASKPHRAPRSIELALKVRDGGRSKHYFELSIWPVAEEDENASPGGTAQRYRIYGTARDITERMEAEAFINFQAYHDLLTRLPNRSLFKDRLAMALTQASRNDKSLAVMFIDLDRFKIINDSLGHTMGDRLLQAVGQRLLECIRKGDTLSRFGGDEFTLLLPDVPSEEGATQVADKILEAIKEPFDINGHVIHVGASIGIAMYPEGGDTLDALIKNADIAMYRVKAGGKDGFQVFRSDMNTIATQRLVLEQDMRRAVDTAQFQVCYQPQIDAETETICGVEALIRWDHPTLGRLGPDEFIPIAEDSRLIVELDKLTLIRACREVRYYHNNGLPNVQLAVNLSPLLVERQNFVEMVLAALAAEDFPPHLLELEITEGLLMSDRSDIVDKLRQLSEAGVQIAIDDFGTGYSSLSYLQKFPISTLKIDKSFTHNIKARDNEACIVDAIVSMAQGLKLKIVAEGVESLAQLHYLKALGCQVVQGYLFGQVTTLPRIAEQFGTTGRVPDPAATTDA